ncbi:MAG TPA: undecaprenyl-diphosphate phosphatase [Alphaproteobacteria bacterium]|nr:undecaprenyl-diphosphate phosphatase [Alphaproteobacteria bacterium]USO05457.1 MAG: undecaprenyl-diphosphate phosphatase [Rhodospirillales bacterium]HOO81735.1 undecaprenyl-diphosphate phosphatase [Alphaproteobacteria bacterium]
MYDFLTAIFVGIVEGLTEFIPVSSTAHLIVLVDGLNFPSPPGHVFEVFIQIGAIFAVMWLYRVKLFHTAMCILREKQSQIFALNLILGSMPALLIGALFHDAIKTMLYNPHVIAFTLIIGAIIMLIFEKRFTNTTVENVDAITPRKALLIGCCQMLALIPGVSRSGATIMGGLTFGLSKPAATEFSFFLSIPVMFAAVLYDTYKNREAIMAFDQTGLLAAGFIAAFLSALLVIKFVVNFISRHGFVPFAWYRIAAGIVIAVVFF